MCFGVSSFSMMLVVHPLKYCVISYTFQKQKAEEEAMRNKEIDKEEEREKLKQIMEERKRVSNSKITLFSCLRIHLKKRGIICITGYIIIFHKKKNAIK